MGVKSNQRAVAQTEISSSGSLSLFFQYILAKRKISDVNWLSPKGEFWHRLEQALDVSKIGSEQARKHLGNSP